MTKRLLMVCATLGTLASCNRNLDLPPTPQFASLTAQLDTGGHVPPENNTVRLINSQSGARVEQQTDVDGKVLFAQLTPGNYLVQADVSGFAPLREGPFSVPSGNPVDVGVFKLVWLGQTEQEGSISGAVIVAGGSVGQQDAGATDAGADDGGAGDGGLTRPSDAMGATVSMLLERMNADPAKVAEVTVDAFGRFSARVPPGRYTIEATHPWYVSAKREGVLLAEGQLLDLGQPLVLQLNPADVSGEVVLEVESLTGGPSTRAGDGVTVTSDTGFSTTTDSTGRYTLPGLAAGTRRITFTRTGFHDGVPLRTITLSAGEHASFPQVRLLLDRGDISGRVRMSDGSQLDDVSVAIAGALDGGAGGYSTQAVRTAADQSAGDFILRNVPVGSYNVVAHRTNYVDATSPTVMVQVDTITPLASELRLARLQGDFLIEDSDPLNTAGFTRDLDVTLVLSNVTNAAEFRAVEGTPQDLMAATYQPYSLPRIPFTLSSGDGPKTISLQIKNTMGNEGPALSATITLDTTPPSNGSILLASGVPFTRLANPLPVTLNALDVGGVAYVRLASVDDGGVEYEDAGVAIPDGGFPNLVAPRVAYVRDTSFQRPVSTDGIQTVAAQFIDNAGNASDVALATIVIDTVPPTGSLSIVRGQRASVDGYTNALLVELAETWGMEPNGGYVQVRLANDALDLSTAVAQPTRAVASWFLDAQGEGTKTVHYVFVDAAGNQAGAAQATIIYDATAPLVTANLLSGSPTSNPQVTIGLSTVETSPYSPDAGVSVSTSAIFSNAQVGPYPGNNQVQFTLSSGDGPRNVFVRVRDAAGNDGTTSVSLELDTTPPSGLGISLVGALADGTPSSTLTSASTVTVNLTQTGATRVLLSDATMTSCPAVSGTWTNITSTAIANHPLPGSGSTRTVTACFADGAGNVAGPVSASINYDGSAPSGCQLALTGLRTNGQPSGVARTALRSVPFLLTNCAETPLEIALTEQTTVLCDATAAGLVWSPYSTTANQVTLSSVDGTKSVRGCVRDAARNTTSFVLGTMTLDTSPPTNPRVVINGGSAYINATAVDAGVALASIAGTALDATEWAYAEEGTTPSNFVSYTTANPGTLALSPGDGVKTVKALFRDDLGNTIAAEVADSIEVDTTPPVLTSLSLLGTLADGTSNTALTASPDVTASLIQTGATTVFFGGAALASCPTTGHQQLLGNTAIVTLTGSGLTRTVKACVGDAAGNVSVIRTATIDFDSVAPSSCALQLTGLRADDASPTSGAAAGLTGRRDVRFTLNTCTEVPTQIALTQSPVSCAVNANLVWTPYDALATNSFNLAGVDGAKTVYGCVRDAARNTGGLVAANVTLDTTPPSGASVVLDGNAPYVNAAQKAARGGVNRASAQGTVTGGYEWALAEGATPTVWRTLAGNNPFNFDFSTGDGVKTVRVLFRDEVGNVTANEVTDSIEFDTVAPTLTSITITGTLADGTPSSVSTANTNVTATLLHSGGTSVAFGSIAALNCTTASYSNFSGTTVSTTLGGSGATRTLSACVQDAAGNPAGPVSSTILFDSTGPTGCTLVMSGRKADGSATALDSTALRDVPFTLSGCVETGTVTEISLTEAATINCAANLDWKPLTGADVLTLSEVDGLKTVRGCVRDQSRNVGSLGADSITLDTTPPSAATVTIKGGAAYFNRADFLAAGSTNTISVSGAATDAVDWAIAESATPSSFGPLVATNFVFSSGDGPKTISALFRDALGNVTPVVVTDGIVVDTVAPTLSAINVSGTLADGTASDVTTSTTSVQLSLTHVDGAGLFVGDGTLASCPSSGYASFGGGNSASITLPGSGATRTVRVCIADVAGNTAGYLQDSIGFDSAAPTGCALTLVGRRTNGTNTSGATANKTALTGVGVTLGSCSETPTELYLVEAGSVTCNAAASLAWQPYVAGSTNFTLTGGDANKTVVGCVRDAARNVSSVTFDDIVLDTTPPTLASVTLFAGAAYFNRANWVAAGSANTMNLNATVTGASDWAWAENATPTAFNAATFPVNQSVTLSVGDGVKTVRALFRDDVGNTTPAEVSDTIEVDTVVPTLSTITLSGTLADGTASSASTSSAAVTVTFAQSGGTLVAMGDSTFTCPSSLASFATFNGLSANTTLTDSTTTRTVGACVADAAGNISNTRTSSILYDATSPTGCVLTLVGRRTDGASTAGTAPEKSARTGVDATLSSCSEVPADIYLVETTGAVACPAAGAAVWQTLSGSTSLGFSLSAGDALKTVKACVRDATRNVSAASFTDTITLDTTPPTGASVVLHGGLDWFNRAAWVSAGNQNRMGVTGSAAGATEWAFSETGTPTTFVAFTSPTTTLNTFAAGEGTKKVYALFRDDVGNTTSELSDGIEVDTIAPTLSSLTLVGTLGDGTSSALISSTTAVTGNVVQSGATSIASGDGTFTCPAGTTFTTFNGSTVSLTLPGAGTTRTMRVCVADAAGNPSGVVQDSIDFDGVAPSGCALVLTGRRVDGVATGGGQVDLTALRDVGISLSGCADTNVEVALTEAVSVTCATGASLSWVPLNTSSTFQLTNIDGSKTVRGCVRDQALNIGSLATDSITLDTAPPDNASVSLNNVNGYANSMSRVASGSADDVTEWAVSTSSTGPFVFVPYSSTPSTAGVNFTAPDGTKVVYARFRDGLLNTTKTVSASVIIDTTPPTPPVLLTVDSENRGARLFWTNSSDATSGIGSYELLADPTGPPTTVRNTADASSTNGYVLNLENRTDNVFAVRAVDNAGNRSALSAQMPTSVGWQRTTVSPGSVYPIRPLDIAARGTDIFITYMETDTNWAGIAGNLRIAVSHDRGTTWSFKYLDSSFGGGRQLAPIAFTDDAIWVASVANPGFTSDIIAGVAQYFSSVDNGDTWTNVTDSDNYTTSNFAKVDSLSLMTSGTNMRSLYLVASANATKQMNVVYASSPGVSTLSPTPYGTSIFGSAPYQVTNGLRSCSGNFSSVSLWRDRSNPSTNAPNLLALTHYFVPDLTYDVGEGSLAYVTAGVGNGQEVGNFDLACTSLSETMQAYVVFDRAPAAAWAVGAGGAIMRYDDTAWVTAASPTPRNIYSVQDVWALGQGYSASGSNYSLILRWNGATWEEIQSTAGNGAYLYDSYTASASNVFAVGSSGTVLRWNGSTWSAMTSATGNTLNGVWGSSGTNVFAVGSAGVVQRYNGTSWATMTSATANTLRAIWGSSSTNVWAVGDSGTIVRYNGSTWSTVASPTSNQLLSIWGSSASDIWAVGSGGVIIRYNGSTWSLFTSPTPYTLNEVSGVSSNDVWAVGSLGTAIRFNGTSWSTQPTETTATLYSVWWGGSSGGAAANLYGTRKLGSQVAFTSPTVVRTDSDRTMPPQIWAGSRNVYVLYRTIGDKLMLGESTNEGASFSNWTTLESGPYRGMYAVLSGDNSSDVAVAFTDINAATMTVMTPSMPSLKLRPIAGQFTSTATWATTPGVDRYQVDSDPDGVQPWLTTDFTSLAQATVVPAPDGGTPYVQVRPVDQRDMPGNTGELWQLRGFNDSTLYTTSATSVSSSNTGGIVAYNDKVLVWPPRPVSNALTVYRSSNSGTTWSTYNPGGTVSSSGPRAIAGFNGRAAMFFQDGTTTTTLRALTFTDIGAGTATLGSIQAGVNLDYISAKASVDNSGLVVAYADATNDLIRVATADAAMNFTIRASISTTAGNTIGALEVAKVDFSTGRVVITWREYSAGDPRTDLIRGVESLNYGASWGTIFTLLSSTSSSSSASAGYDIGSTDLSGANNGAYSVLARTTEYNDYWHKPSNLYVTVTGTDHNTTVSSSSYVNVKLDSETVDSFAFDAFANSDGHYLAWRAETLDGTVSKLRFAYCFSDCHLYSSWDFSLLKVWTSFVKDQGRYVDMTVAQTTGSYDPVIYVLYTESALSGSWRNVNILSRGVHRRIR